MAVIAASMRRWIVASSISTSAVGKVKGDASGLRGCGEGVGLRDDLLILSLAMSRCRGFLSGSSRNLGFSDSLVCLLVAGLDASGSGGVDAGVGSGVDAEPGHHDME